MPVSIGSFPARQIGTFCRYLAPPSAHPAGGAFFDERLSTRTRRFNQVHVLFRWQIPPLWWDRLASVEY